MKYLSEYKPVDKHVVINGSDKDLRPVVLSLPEPPEYEYIDGYGLPPLEQKFHRLEIPERLKMLETRASENVKEWASGNVSRTTNGYLEQTEYWKLMDAESDSFEEEIEFIKKVHWHMRHGYWFFNKGQPTWVTPWHFFYLNFWYMKDTNDHYPEYRDKDRRAEVFEWYCFTATETFKNLDEKGRAIDMEMIDVGHKVFYGTHNPKRRREGATQKGLCKGLWIQMTTSGGECEIISDTGDHAKEAFLKKLVPAWREMPMFLRPIWDGKYSPPSQIKMDSPSSNTKQKTLESTYSFTDSSAEGANDSRKLHYLMSDEEGKRVSRADVQERWKINRLTMSQGFDIHGWSNHPSTVEKMVEGGKVYEDMAKDSDFYVRRSESGQTLSGLGRYFFPAYDGMDFFIDPWGFSVIDKPTQEQMDHATSKCHYASRGMGAKQSLTNELNVLLGDGSPERQSEYRRELRKMPMRYADCWLGVSGEIGFDTLILDKAILNAKRRRKEIIVGNFEWAGGVRGSTVIFREDPAGRFMFSDLMPSTRNQWQFTSQTYRDSKTGNTIRQKMPVNPKLVTIGADPFEFRVSGDMKYAASKTRKSDGGIAILRNFDPVQDAGKEEADCTTGVFIGCYRARPDHSTFLEDVLLSAVYCNGMVCPERQNLDIQKHFIESGFAGYLLYLQKPDGTLEAEPGVWASTQTKNEMFNKTSDHIKKHGLRELMLPILEEWRSITGPERLKDYDLVSAAGWAIIGSERGSQSTFDRISSRQIDISGSILAQR